MILWNLKIENGVEALCAYIKYNCPGKTIWLWSGYSWLDVRYLDVLKYVDVLVDGPFIEKEKDLRLPYCGSRNQNVIDVQRSLKAGLMVRWEN